MAVQNATIFPADVVIYGNLSPATLTIPAGTLTNAGVAASAAIAYSKVQQLINKMVGDNSTTNASTYTKTIHVAKGATGTVLGFYCGSVAIAGAATTLTVDLKKNGSSILSAVYTLDNTKAARTVYAATVSSASYVVGDWFEVTFTLTGANPPTGVQAILYCSEDPT